MTDKELRDAAVTELKKTSVGWLKSNGQPRYPPGPSPTVPWGKAMGYLAQIGQAAPPPPPPPPPPPTQFGTQLPARLPESTGAIRKAATVAEYRTALDLVQPNESIELTQSMGFQNQQFNISLWGTANATITITASPGVKITDNNMWYLPQMKFVRFRGLEFAGGQDAIKPGHVLVTDVEFDRMYVHHLKGQGFLSSGGDNLQLWNSRFHNNGDELNLDHNIYWSKAPGPRPCVIANCLGYDPWAYNFQLYPNVKKMIVTCCTMDGYTEQPEKRGGLVIGSEGTPTTGDNTIVGLIGTNAPYYCIKLNGPLAPNNKSFDCIGRNNGAGNYDTHDPNMSYENCIDADPLYVNRAAKDFHLRPGSPAIGHIKPARYGLVPPRDIDGKLRVTADAGCYAA